MNYYEHHIGDYAEATAHLTFVEDAAYSRCLRKYYATERPLPPAVKDVQRLVGARTKEERAAVESVLAEFFTLEPDGWHQKRVDEELARYAGKRRKAQASANVRWNKGDANAMRSHDDAPTTPAPAPHSDDDANAMRTHSDGNAGPHDGRNALQSPVTSHQTPSSVADATGAKAPRKPPSDPVKAEVWSTGRAILEAQGEDKKSAGDFLGKLCRDFGQVLVLEAVRDCARTTPAEAKAWLVARCQERRALGVSKQAQLEARNAAVADNWQPPEVANAA